MELPPHLNSGGSIFDPDEINNLDDWISKAVPEDRHLFSRILGRQLSGQIKELEYRIQTAEGDIVCLKDTSSPLKDNYQKVIGRVGAVQDIPHTKKAEIRLKRLATAVTRRKVCNPVTDGLQPHFHGGFYLLFNKD